MHGGRGFSPAAAAKRRGPRGSKELINSKWLPWGASGPPYIFTRFAFSLSLEQDLELTTLEPEPGGNVAGALTNVRFVEVDRRGNNRIVDGLTACIDLWEFSGMFEDWSH